MFFKIIPLLIWKENIKQSVFARFQFQWHDKNHIKRIEENCLNNDLIDNIIIQIY